MLNSYNITTQEVLTNGTLTFTTDRILTGCTATRNGVSFQLNKSGYYFISFEAVGATSDDAGDVTVTLRNNSVDVPGATATFYSEADTNVGTLSFTTIIRVPPSCCAVDNTAALTVVNTGVGATYTNANMVITKLC